MRNTRILLTGLFALLFLAISAGPAGAAQRTARADTCPSSGYLCAYEHVDYGGSICGWFANDRDWAYCDEYRANTTSMINKASSIKNKTAGYGEPNNVNLYYNKPNQGASAWACIGQGDSWNWLGRRYFTWGPTGSGTGHGLPTENDIAGHKWVTNCGDL